MGYTVYYNNKEKNKNAANILRDPKRFQKFKEDFVEVMQIFNIPQVADYTDLLENSADEYASNASDTCGYVLFDNEVALYGPHESFNFPSYQERKLEYGGDPSFTFTKTNGKSYDGLIKILYLLGKKHYGGEISHDGCPEDYLAENKDSYTESDQLAMLNCLAKFELMSYLPLEDEELELNI